MGPRQTLRQVPLNYTLKLLRATHWHFYIQFLLYFEKRMTCFRAYMALEWFISFSKKHWKKLSAKFSKGSSISSLKKGPEATASFAFSWM